MVGLEERNSSSSEKILGAHEVRIKAQAKDMATEALGDIEGR